MTPVGLQTAEILKTLSGCFNAASFALGRTSQADGQIANPDALVTGADPGVPGTATWQTGTGSLQSERWRGSQSGLVRDSQTGVPSPQVAARPPLHVGTIPCGPHAATHAGRQAATPPVTPLSSITHTNSTLPLPT